MNHCVPEFYEMEDDDSIPMPSGFSRPKKPTTGEEEIMELLWQNGQVVVQSQNQRPSKKSGGSGEVVIPAEREIRSSAEEQQQQHLFMQEDEMASWLQYPLDDSSFDRDFYADLLYSAPPPPPPLITTTAEIRPPPRPPIPTPVARPDNPPRVHNFVHFSRLPIRPRTEAAPPPVRTVRESSTVVESNETPVARPESKVSHTVADSRPPMNADSAIARTGGTSAAAGDFATATCDLTVTSSPGGSRTSFSGETHQPQQNPAAADDRKRKAREADDTEYQSEDIEFEAAETKKQARGSASTKRSRAAEVHNLSERRRRDRINEKMRALQELIPRCNKSDKASMLDEAIEYLKSLQLQVQMMSMGCGMVPMMYPGMQQYMPAMGMGMGMGMGMDMGMSRPMVHFPSMMPGSAMPNPAATVAHMGPRFPLPPFHMQPVPVPDPSRLQATNHTDPAPNSTIPQNQNQHRFPNFSDPYQQYLGFHHTQPPIPQNQGVVQHDANKPSTSKDIGNPHNQQTG